MSSDGERTMGLSGPDADALGTGGAARVRLFRLLLVLGQELRTQMDSELRPGGMTTQQAALTGVVEAMGSPSLSQAAAALGTTHQNVKHLARALERKGHLEIRPDPADARVRRLELTEASRAFWRERGRGDQERVQEWFAGVSDAEAEAAYELLLRLREGARGAPVRASRPWPPPDPGS
jgi:DNA-binding MarR family transcriptional regulator